MIFWLNVLAWVLAVACLVMAIWTSVSWRRARRSVARIQAQWATQAPPVPPVDVVLRTGERLTVQPTEVHAAWIWMLPVPVPPGQVDAIEIPELPPWTQIVPFPHEIKPPLDYRSNL